MRKWFKEIEEVRRMRERGKSLNEICRETGISKATVYGWIKDMPVPVIDGVSIRVRGRSSKYWSQETSQKRADAIQRIWKSKRDFFERKGRGEAKSLLREREIRDFACLYLAEGTKKGRGTVEVINTDPSVIGLCARMMRRFSARKIFYRLFCSEYEREELLDFWSKVLGIDGESIRFQNKKQVSARRAEFGLLSVGTSDTYFKCRLTAWIDRVKHEWSRSRGVTD